MKSTKIVMICNETLEELFHGRAKSAAKIDRLMSEAEAMVKRNKKVNASQGCSWYVAAVVEE